MNEREMSYLTLGLGTFVGALIGYSNSNRTGYSVAMALLVAASFVGIWLALEFATSRARVILHKPSSNERIDT